METTGAPVPISKALVTCEPVDVAAWIGLGDASKIGNEPIQLTARAVDKLKQFGARVELSTLDAAAILRITRNTVTKLVKEGRAVRLGHRRDAAGALVIPAEDLAAFIDQKAQPPVPTTGKAPKVDLVAAKRTAAEVRRRFNLPAA